MNAHLRGPMGEVNKLVVALKMHFLDFLDRDERIGQLAMLEEVCDKELIRLGDLRDHHQATGGLLLQWLEREIFEIKSRREWFGRVRESL
jgi:hypothetical protein